MDPRPDDEDDPDELELASLVDAMLDGTPVDWAVAESPGGSDPSVARQLHVVADLAALHRTLSITPETFFTWGHLEILEKVGEGAFGEVYRAWDSRLNREVALKIFAPPGVLDDTDRRSWVIEEARFLASIRHPNVVTVYGADRIGGRLGFWTEFIHGRTLAALVQEHGPFSAPEAAAIGRDVCRALSAVHAAGLLHRDIKANNVMREHEGRIVLLDFGATKNFIAEAAADAAIDHPEGPTGTPLYVAPELWRASPATPQSDIYSVGVLLYFLVTGSYPVRGATVGDVGEAHRTGQRTALRDVRTELPDAFVQIVEQAIDPDPVNRFASIGALESALDRMTANARSIGDRRALWTNWRLLAVAASVVAISAVAVAMQLRHAGAPLVADALSQSPSPRPALAAPPVTTSPPNPGPTAAPVPQDVAQRLKKITIPNFTMGHPSRDGRYMPYVDDDGTVQVLEIETGRSHPVTPRGAAGAQGVDWVIRKDGSHRNYPFSLAAISPHGDQVAYTWLEGDAMYAMKIVGVDGRFPRTLLETRSEYEPFPVDWSADGRSILCWLQQVNGDADLVLVSVDDGSRKPLFHKTGGIPDSALSPDGRFATFPILRPGLQISFLAIVGTDGAEPKPLFAADGQETSPVWTDNTHLLFLRPSTTVLESTDVWIARVVDGVAVDEPVRLFENIGRTDTVLTAAPDKGVLYTCMATYATEIYSLSVDLAGAAPAGLPDRMSNREVGHHASPSWSPSGRWLAYFTGQPPKIPGDPDDWTPAILDVSSGRMRPLHADIERIRAWSAQWFSDGSSLAIFGVKKGENGGAWHRVDVQTGATTVLMRPVSPFARLPPDDSGLTYPNNEGAIVTRTFAGDETVVVPPGVWLADSRFGLSHGGAIAFLGQITEGGHPMVVLQVQTADRSRSVVVSAEPSDGLRFQAWTGDGQNVLYSRGASPQELWMVPAAGGEARDLHIKVPIENNPITISPDGRRIFYPARVKGQELWIRTIPGLHDGGK